MKNVKHIILNDMSKIYFYRFVILSFVICQMTLFSCGNRNPNLPKGQLLALLNDTTSTKAATSAFVSPDTSYVPPAGAKYTEIRSVDPASPPVTLKVDIPVGAKQPLKLSRFGSSVRYVTLRLPDENDFFLSNTSILTYYSGGGSSSGRSTTQVNLLGDHFVTSDALGIRLFDLSGKYVQDLLMSEINGKQSAEKIEIDHESGYKRAVLNDISGTRCLLTLIDYEGGDIRTMMYLHTGNIIPLDTTFDRNKGKVWAGEFDVANRPFILPQQEIPSATPGVELYPVRTVPAGKYIDDTTRFDFQMRMDGTIAISFNSMGDTLAKFTNHVASGGAYITDRSFSYRDDGDLFFRQEYNDTIFRVQSADRIVPAYLFDFGSQRITAAEGAANKAQGKLMPWKLLVFQNAILLIFTEGRDCPACRTANEVIFHCLMYDKQTGRSTAIDLKSRYPEYALIENDIDGGLPIPLNTIKIEDNRMIATYTKSQIEEILQNNAANIPPETATKLKAQADALKQNEMLVVIVY